MKHLQLLFIFLCLSIQGVQAQGENVTATWTFETGAENQAATISSNSIFSSNLVQLTGMKYAGQRKWNDEYYTQLQPTVENGNAPTDAVRVAFTLIPSNGISFKPTKVSFDCIRIGTGGCNVDYAIAVGENTPVTLETGLHPNRNNSDYTECTHASAAVTGVEATNGKALQLILYVYNLATSKQIALKNIVIEGTATGTATGDVYHTLTVKVNPEGGAVVTQQPEGTSFVKGTPVSFTVTANEGYRFLKWTDGNGNILSEGKTYRTTMTEDKTVVAECHQLPNIDRGCYDFIVPDDGTVKDALEMANERKDDTKRYRIFIRPGDHQMPASKTETSLGSDGVEYPSPNNYVEKSNISFIGLDYHTTTFRNTLPQVYVDSKYGPQHPLEGNNPDALTIKSGVKETYFQGVTVKSDMKDKTGRNAALKDRGDKTVFKDAALWGYQDTYVSSNNNGRFYFEGGLLRGKTDFLCGGGDVFYNGVELVMCASGGKVTAPGTKKQYGYVFRNCRITGPAEVDGNYTLGRPWGQGTPAAIYIDTEMEVVPSTLGWDEMGDGYPYRFAEYNSHKPDGSTISLSGRKTTFSSTHSNNPVLTAEEAATYTIEAVMGSTDGWNPAAMTRQIDAPANVRLDGTTLSWDAVNGAIGYVVCSADTAVAFTCQTQCTVPDANGQYTVRAANEMGGLGAPSQGVNTSIRDITSTQEGEQKIYNINGVDMTGRNLQQGIYIIDRKKVMVK